MTTPTFNEYTQQQQQEAAWSPSWKKPEGELTDNDYRLMLMDQFVHYKGMTPEAAEYAAVRTMLNNNKQGLSHAAVINSIDAAEQGNKTAELAKEIELSKQANQDKMLSQAVLGREGWDRLNNPNAAPAAKPTMNMENLRRVKLANPAFDAPAFNLNNVKF